MKPKTRWAMQSWAKIQPGEPLVVRVVGNPLPPQLRPPVTHDWENTVVCPKGWCGFCWVIGETRLVEEEIGRWEDDGGLCR